MGAPLWVRKTTQKQVGQYQRVLPVEKSWQKHEQQIIDGLSIWSTSTYLNSIQSTARDSSERVDYLNGTKRKQYDFQLLQEFLDFHHKYITFLGGSTVLFSPRLVMKIIPKMARYSAIFPNSTYWFCSQKNPNRCSVAWIQKILRPANERASWSITVIIGHWGFPSRARWALSSR